MPDIVKLDTSADKHDKSTEPYFSCYTNLANFHAYNKDDKTVHFIIIGSNNSICKIDIAKDVIPRLSIYSDKTYEVSNSSTGKETKTEPLLYIFINKCRQPYGGGLAVSIANNQEEAHACLLEGLLLRRQDYLMERYNIEEWVLIEGPVVKGEARFISECSYVE